jgi:Fur family ferric uptake transcriptional regulator
MEALELLKKQLARTGQKMTAQRQKVLDVFAQMQGHVTADEIYEHLNRQGVHVGKATIYRTLNLLCECGLANQRQFGGSARYESGIKQHHEHLICLRCGSIEEFEHPTLERLKEQVARKHGFQMTGHRLDIFGVCRRCQDESGERSPHAKTMG